MTDQATTTNPDFAIQRLYIKDLSFESPNSPEVFQSEWKPELSLDINTDAKLIGNDIYEVVLKLTVKVKMNDKIPFLIEIKQAGLFLLKGFPEEQLRYMLGAFCPNIIFPYAREIISDMTMRGGFPPLYLTPINFDSLYQQHSDELKKKQGGSSGTASNTVIA